MTGTESETGTATGTQTGSGTGTGAGGTVVIHNNPLAVFSLYAFALFTVFLAVCMVLEVIDLVLIQHGHPFMRWLTAVQWAGAAFGFAYMALACCGIAGKLRYARAQFDDAGLHLRLGTRKKTRESFFAWNQISEIDTQQVGTNWAITVKAKNGDYAWYTPYDIFRYMKTAKMISARSDVPITQLPPYKAPAKKASIA
jgi:hypothetical protein